MTNSRPSSRSTSLEFFGTFGSMPKVRKNEESDDAYVSVEVAGFEHNKVH